MTRIVEFHITDPCAGCGVLRKGQADMRRRAMRVIVPARCPDGARCRGDIEGLLRAEVRRLDAE